MTNPSSDTPAPEAPHPVVALLNHALELADLKHALDPDGAVEFELLTNLRQAADALRASYREPLDTVLDVTNALLAVSTDREQLEIADLAREYVLTVPPPLSALEADLLLAGLDNQEAEGKGSAATEDERKVFNQKVWAWAGRVRRQAHELELVLRGDAYVTLDDGGRVMLSLIQPNDRNMWMMFCTNRQKLMAQLAERVSAPAPERPRFDANGVAIATAPLSLMD